MTATDTQHTQHTRRAATTPHPLEPLAADEIATSSAIIKRQAGLSAATRFISIALREPAKEAVLGFPDHGVPDREAIAVLRDRHERRTYEAVVSLTHGRLVSWRHVPNAQPPITTEEFTECEQAVRDDPRWQEAMRGRGIHDLSTAVIDAWPTGYTADHEDPGERRLVTPLTYVRSGPGHNPYAKPVDGLFVRVDLDRMEVLTVEDHGATPLPPSAGNYTPELVQDPGNWPTVSELRNDLKPIDITQPEGPSFTVDGRAVHWQKWHVRIGFTPREGLVLHQLGYEDQGRIRPIIYRASLSEMFTPYGDPGVTHQRKHAFDEGEYGAGFMVNRLEPGCDCLGEIHYFDATVNDQDGDPVVLPNAVCMHEEDFGVGWKHTDFRTGEAETRRSRRLVISSFAVLGNYQYGYFWYLYLDGTIQFEIKLTGMVSTGAFDPAEPPAHGTVVAPGLYAPNHQHIFNMRLDMCVDGTRNSVYETNPEMLETHDERLGESAWIAESTLLASEHQAQRLADPLRGRYWMVANPHSRNSLDQPVAYKLMPGDNILPLQGEGSQAWRRAQFAYKHLWVTPYQPDQLFAAGDYPNQSPTDHGLPHYTRDDRPVDDTDVVLWYTFGENHVVRPEDWPAMPVSCIGFQLKPAGFFDANPALDIPPASGTCHTTRRTDEQDQS